MTNDPTKKTEKQIPVTEVNEEVIARKVKSKSGKKPKPTLTAELPESLFNAFNEYASKTNRTKKAAAITILKYFFLSEKKWLLKIGVSLPADIQKMSLEEFKATGIGAQ